MVIKDEVESESNTRVEEMKMEGGRAQAQEEGVGLFLLQHRKRCLTTPALFFLL